LLLIGYPKLQTNGKVLRDCNFSFAAQYHHSLGFHSMLHNSSQILRSTPWHWLACVYFVGAAVAALSGTLSLAMLLLALLGLVLFAPPIRRLTLSRYKFALSGWALVPTFGVLLVSIVLATSYSRESAQRNANEEKRRTEAAEVEAKRQYFVAHKAEVIGKVGSLTSDKRYDEALALGEPYWSISKDADLRAALDLSVKARILSTLNDKLSVSDKATAYATLAKLEPNNPRYQKEAKRLGMLQEVEQKKLAAKRAEADRLTARGLMLEKQFSKWDGSHPGVEAVVKRMMKNPDSYDHVETRYVDLGKGMRVIMTYRGTNGFGGIVPSTVVATVSDTGNVLSLEMAR
jgi:hypothetical protein